jgi:hypothetical protein
MSHRTFADYCLKKLQQEAQFKKTKIHKAEDVIDYCCDLLWFYTVQPRMLSLIDNGDDPTFRFNPFTELLHANSKPLMSSSWKELNIDFNVIIDAIKKRAKSEGMFVKEIFDYTAADFNTATNIEISLPYTENEKSVMDMSSTATQN